MDQKGHITDQKGLKMYEKRQKMEFLDLKYLLFSGIFLSGIGGYPQRPKKTELSGWQLSTRKNFPDDVRKLFSQQKKTRK